MLAVTNGTMPITIVVHSAAEFDEITAVLKGKRKSKHRDPSLIDVRIE